MIAVETKRTYSAILLGILLVGVVSLLFLPLPALQSPGMLAFLGRLHPILVHFPIVLVPALTLFYLAIRWKNLNGLDTYIRAGWLGTIAVTVAAVGAGYLLYASGEYGGQLIQRHLNGAVVATALLITGAIPVCMRDDKHLTGRVSMGVALALIGANGALVYTGHQGGSLTHGEGYLLDALPQRGESDLLNKPLHEAQVYGDLVVPILEAKCMACHNENKSKGDLLLTSVAHMNAGGKSGKPAVTAGMLDQSELYQRIILPSSDEDVMPPEGKSPLQPLEIDIIAWWIAEGANTDKVYGEGPADSTLALQIQNYMPSLRGALVKKRRDRKEFRLLASEFIKVASPLGLHVQVDVDSDSSLFDVSVQFPVERRIDDNTVSSLRPYASSISSLSLVGTDITDDALFHIASMHNLQALYLANTAIDGSGIAYLKELDQLRVINLSNTEFSDTYAFDVAVLPALSTLYVFNTKMDANVEAALAAFRSDVNVHHEEGPFTKRK